MSFYDHDNFIVDKFDWLAYNESNSKEKFFKRTCYLCAMIKEVEE